MKTHYEDNENKTPYDDSQKAMMDLELIIASNMANIFNALLEAKKRMDFPVWEIAIEDMIDCHKDSRDIISEKFLDLLSDINKEVKNYDAEEDDYNKAVDMIIDERLGK